MPSTSGPTPVDPAHAEALTLLDRWIPEGTYATPDPLTGVSVRQVTTGTLMATNIYGEDPPCSKDANRAAIIRHRYVRGNGPGELWIYDYHAERTRLVELDLRLIDLCFGAYGDFVVYTTTASAGRELVRFSLATLERETVYRIPENQPPFARWGAISPDQKFIANVRMREDCVFEVVVIDLARGTQKVVAEGADLCNAHVSFDRVDGSTIWVQQNRGQRLTREGAFVTDDPKIGATLFVVPRDGGPRTILPIAPPDYPVSISGHEAWVKNKRQIVFSAAGVHATADGRRASLLRYTLGDKAPVPILHDGLYHGHVSTSECGQFWCNDLFTPNDGIVIAVGHIDSGKSATVCKVGGEFWQNETGHAHPYLAPDRSRVLFVSTRTGLPQVHEAKLPPGFLDALAR